MRQARHESGVASHLAGSQKPVNVCASPVDNPALGPHSRTANARNHLPKRRYVGSSAKTANCEGNDASGPCDFVFYNVDRSNGRDNRSGKVHFDSESCRLTSICMIVLISGIQSGTERGRRRKSSSTPAHESLQVLKSCYLL